MHSVVVKRNVIHSIDGDGVIVVVVGGTAVAGTGGWGVVAIGTKGHGGVENGATAVSIDVTRNANVGFADEDVGANEFVQIKRVDGGVGGVDGDVEVKRVLDIGVGDGVGHVSGGGVETDGVVIGNGGVGVVD